MSSTEQAHGSIDSNYSEQKRLVALAQTAYTADLIDLCKDIESASLAYSNYSEQKRLVALAQTAYEETAMWAVKAATTKK